MLEDEIVVDLEVDQTVNSLDDISIDEEGVLEVDLTPPPPKHRVPRPRRKNREFMSPQTSYRPPQN